MTQARRSLISLSDTPYYHCINRCVRRAFLCGEDRHTGRNYTHRKQWVVEKIKELSALFAIDVCAFAILSNHYHVVLHVDEKRSLEWDDEEVVSRWNRLFSGALLVDRYMAGQCGSDAEVAKALEVISPVSKEPRTEQGLGESGVLAAPLVEFAGATGDTEFGLPFHFSDYLVETGQPWNTRP